MAEHYFVFFLLILFVLFVLIFRRCLTRDRAPLKRDVMYVDIITMVN